MAQTYIEKQSGKITTLKNADQIFNHETSKYYSIKKAIPKKLFTGTFIEQHTFNKGGEVAVVCYFICPLSDFIDSNGSNNIWIGVSFSNSYANGGSAEDVAQRQRSIKAFIDSSLIKYQSYTYSIKYLERLYLSQSDNYINAINNTNLKYDPYKLVILAEPERDYNDRTNGAGSIALISLGAANLFWILACVMINSNSPRRRKRKVPVPASTA